VEEQGSWCCECGTDEADVGIGELDACWWRWAESASTPSAKFTNEVVGWRVGRLIQMPYLERSRLEAWLARLVIRKIWSKERRRRDRLDQPKATIEMRNLGKAPLPLDYLQYIAATQDKDCPLHCLLR
jgi:hypothetical protein